MPVLKRFRRGLDGLELQANTGLVNTLLPLCRLCVIRVPYLAVISVHNDNPFTVNFRVKSRGFVFDKTVSSRAMSNSKRVEFRRNFLE